MREAAAGFVALCSYVCVWCVWVVGVCVCGYGIGGIGLECVWMSVEEYPAYIFFIKGGIIERERVFVVV